MTLTKLNQAKQGNKGKQPMQIKIILNIKNKNIYFYKYRKRRKTELQNTKKYIYEY